MEPFTLNKDILYLIGRIALFEKSILLSKEGDKIFLRQRNDYQIFIEMEMNKSIIDFVPDYLAFSDFISFKNFFTKMKTPLLYTEENKIVLKNGTSKGYFILSDKSVISKKTFSKADYDFENSEHDVDLNKSDCLDLNDMISDLKAENVKFEFSDKEVKISALGEKFQNSYEKTLSTASQTSVTTEYVINSNLFKLIPILDYRIRIKIQGTKPAFNFNYKHHSFNLNFYLRETLKKD